MKKSNLETQKNRLNTLMFSFFTLGVLSLLITWGIEFFAREFFRLS